MRDAVGEERRRGVPLFLLAIGISFMIVSKTLMLSKKIEKKLQTGREKFSYVDGAFMKNACITGGLWGL